MKQRGAERVSCEAKQRRGRGEEKEKKETVTFRAICSRLFTIFTRNWTRMVRSSQIDREDDRRETSAERSGSLLYGSGASAESRLDKQGCQTDVSALWATVRAATGRSSRKLLGSSANARDLDDRASMTFRRSIPDESFSRLAFRYLIGVSKCWISSKQSFLLTFELCRERK